MAQFLTIQRVAERYDTSKHSIYRWMRDGGDFPPPVRMPSGVMRWSEADLEAWESERKIPSA